MIHKKSNIPINRKRDPRTSMGVLKEILLILLFVGSLSQLKAQSFVHPGIPFTTDDLNQLKTNIANGNEPWASMYTAFANSSYSSLNYGMQGPYATVGRAPDVHLTQWQNDMRAVFHLSLMWSFTNNTAYAAKATAILDSWATTNTKWGGEETFLALGDYSEYFVTGADILKSTYSGWTTVNTSHVNSYFTNVIWPELDVPNPVRPMNQGCIQLKAALSVAAFLDDAVKWNQAINSYRTDVGGSLYNSLPNGQVGDAGRDEGHWRGQVQALAWGAEVAWKQGVDLFSEMDNRLLKIGELYCRYHLSTSNLVYTPFGGPYAYYTGWADDGSPKQLFNAFNIISNAYTNRKGISTPFTDRFSDLKGNDIYTFLFLKSSDNSTATQPEAVVYPTTSATTLLTSTDVGNTGMAGSTSYSNGMWTVKGAGALPVPPNSSVDAFHFSFQKVTDDASIIAQVTSIENTGDNVRVGIMMRESLAADSKYVGLFMPAGGGILATWRGASAWSKTSTSWNTPATKGLQTNPGSIPQWLKLVRRGTRVSLLHSNDSINWSGVAEAEIALPATAYIGLVVASNSTSKLNTATFSNISITNSSPAGSPVISSSLGTSGVVGSAFSYAVTGTNQPTSFSAENLPDGLSINPATGIISGTPTVFGTTYVTITATNANGTTSAVLKIDIANSTAPSAPVTVTTIPVNTYSVGLSWSASPGTTSYTVKHSSVSGGPYSIIASGITDTTFVDDAALPKANYYIVEAFSGSLESSPSTETLITLLPDVADSVVVVGGNSNATISWAAADGATGYNVKRSSVTGGPYASIATGITATSYVDTGLTNGQVYYYVVSSVSDAGESANSVEKTGTPGSATVKWASSPVTGNWNNGNNWEESTVPPAYASLVFGASSSATLSNDMDSLKVSKIIFNTDAPVYTIGGNVLMPGTEITNNSTSLQTINTPLMLRNVLAVNSNTGSTQLLGTISGTGSIIINNTSATNSTIGGSNTYSGGTTVYGNWNGVWGSPNYALNISGSGTGAIGAPTGGALGTGPVYLKGGCLVNSGYAKLYNDIYLASNTNSYAITNPGGLEFAGRFIGDGNFSLECNYGYPYYTFSGDNSAFTGKFTTIKRTSYFRMAITSAAAGSAKAKWEFNPNFNADCLRLQFNGTIEFGEFAGVGSMHAFGGTSPILSIGALNTDATYGGTASDGTSFIKVGTGTQRFAGVNTYWGTTTVQSGKFYVNNDFASPVIVNGGIFGGVGLSSASVTVNSGGTLSPGDDGLGMFTTTNTITATSDATLAIEISSSGVASDGIVASGITLNNATLSLTDINPGALPAGTNFTLINNTGSAAVVGAFNGLPEYSTITIGSYNFQITYKGGTGNDVVLLDERTVPAYITSASTGVISIGQLFTYTLTSNRTILSSSATGLPQGLTLNSTTGVISGTPTVAGVYTIAISAVTDKGTTTGTLVLTVNTNAAPSTPAGLAAANAGLAKALLTWNKLSATQLVTGYSLKRSATSGGPYTTIATGVTDTTYTDTGLSYNVTYYYVISASNSFGESTNSGQVTVTTLSPPIPSAVNSLSAVNGNAKINLRWSPNKYTENFTVKRSTVSGGSYTTIATAITDTSYVDNTVSNATTYYYVVTAKNISGESANSNEAVATPESTANNWWSFNEATGSTVTDVWGSKNGTLNAGTRVSGVQGSAINLAGTSTNYVSLPSGIVSSVTNFTISFWVKPTTITNWMRLFDFGTGTTNYMFFAMSTGSTPRYAIRTTSVAEKVINSSTALTLGKWSHVAITQSGSTATMYINGVVVGSNTSMTLSPSSLGNTTLNYIGKSQFSSDPYLNASVDDFRIYGRSLSASEIATVMNTEVLKAPTSVIASGAYKNVSVSWTASAKATAYNVKRSAVSGGPYTTIGAGITTTSYVDTTVLMANYYYVVTGISGSNESFVSNEASVSITAVPNVPAVPSNVTVIPGNAKVTVTWQAASDAAVYRVKRASVTGGPYTVLGVTSALTYTDNTASNGVTYYYVVSAKNVSGESVNSTEKSAVPFTYAWSYWPMNENTGTTTADYWSTRTGTLNGSTGISWTTGVSGSGILFNPASSNPYVSMPSGIVSSLTDFTISAWVKPNALSTWSRVFDFGTSTSNYMFLSVSNGSVPRFAIRTASVAENGINSSTALQAGKWAHMVVTQSGSTAIMYINGVEVGRNSAMALNPSSMGTTTQNYFGKSQWSDPYLNGVLDDIRIYSKSLSTSEIAALVNEFAPANPSTVTATGSYKNVLIDWSNASGATSYNIKRATVSGGPYTTLATGITTLSYTDATATYGTYYYVVTSSADNKEGIPSGEAAVMLPPATITNARATGWNNRIDISWAGSSGATSYNVKRSDVSGGPYTLISTVTTTAYNDATAINDTPYYYTIEAVGTGGSSVSNELSATPINTTLSNTWKHTDVGAVGITGNTQPADSTLTLYGSGSDIYFQTDMFQLVYQRISGNVGIVTRIADQQNTRSYARAGLTIRDSVTTNAIHATLTNTPTGIKEFISRTTTTSNAVEDIVSNQVDAKWLRLVRQDTIVSAYYSQDGINWLKQNSMTIKMRQSAYVGLVNCAANNTVINTTVFDHVYTSVALPEITSDSITATIGDTITYAIVATNSPYAYTAVGLPQGLIINSKNGIITGIPAVAGSFAVQLIAINAMGADTTTLAININKKDQSITFNALDTQLVGNSDFSPGAISSSGLPVSYTSSDTTVATIVNGQIHIAGAGSSVITASQTGNATYSSAVAVDQSLTVSKRAQIIAFNAIAPKQVWDADFNPGATSTSGLIISYSSSDTTVATIVNGLVHLVKAGTTTIVASQSGDHTYLPAASVSQSVTVQAALTVQYLDGDNNKTNNQIKPYLKIVNSGSIAVPYSELTARYWFTAENYAGVSTWIDYAQLGASKIHLSYVTLSQPRNSALGYAEFRFDTAAGNIAANGNSGAIQSRLANSDWSNLSESDDYSYLNATSYVANSHITLYRNGKLIYGIEPAVVTPVLSLKVYSQTQTSAANIINTYLKVSNEGNVSVNYGDISVRYWFTSEGTSTLNYKTDYAKLGNTNITGQFVKFSPALSGADTYLELKVASTVGKFYPLSNTGNIQYHFNKADWGNFNQTDDYSYLPVAPFAENNHITIYNNGVLIYGTEPAGFNARTSTEQASADFAEPIQVYPNPVTGDHVFIRMSDTAGKDDVAVKIYSLVGKPVVDKRVKPNEPGLLEIKLDDTIDSGIYLIRLNNLPAMKLIIQR